VDSLVQAKDAASLAKLAKLLEAMKPAEAASVVSGLDTEQIVALVLKMKDRTAGRMLAALPPDVSVKVALRMSQAAVQTRGKS
jgi:flagellar motility protein MotE (MotC chaperone)